MRKKMIFGLSAACLLLWLVLFMGEKVYYGLGVLSPAEYDRIVRTHTPLGEPLTECALFEEQEIFYDAATDTYLVTADSAGQAFTGCGGASLFWAPQEFSHLEEDLADSKPLRMVLVRGDGYAEYAVQISSLPLIRLTQEDPGVQIDREPVPARITVMTPLDAETGRHTQQEYACTVNLRGQTAYNMPKKSYEVDLKDKAGQPLKASLLGMRKDDDWALNGAYCENSKIREPMLTTLWRETLATEQAPSVYGFTLKNCELLLNDTYLGIFQLLEPVDAKQEKIDPVEDRLYKYTGWIINSPEDLMRIDAIGGPVVSGVKLKNAKTASMENRWYPLAEYSRVFLARDEADTGCTLAQARRVADLENLIDCSIFLNLFQLQDNNPKNMFYVYRASEGEPRLYRDLWDMNYSLGAGYDNDLNRRCVRDIGVTPVVWDIETACLVRGPDAAEFFAQYARRYRQLRGTVLSEEHLLELAAQEYQALAESGACVRENRVWTTAPVDFAAEYTAIQDYLREKLLQMDAAVENMARELGVA